MIDEQISPWMPEQDRVRLATLAKLAEECNELAARASRCIMQGIDEHDPKSGLPNREELVREMADVRACMDTAVAHFGLDASDDARYWTKYQGYCDWHYMIVERSRADRS